MRILTTSYEYPPIGGGGAQVAAGLSQELVRMGHAVDVITMGFQGLPREETVDGVRVHRVPCRRRSKSKCTAWEAASYLMATGPIVSKLLKRGKHDLVHTHFIFPDGILAWRKVKPRSIPYVITAHGSDVPGYNQKSFFRIAHPFLVQIWRRVTRNAAAIVSPSQSLARLIRASSSDIPVSVIPNGISPNKFRPRKEKQNRILVATRLVERKGVQYLLRALLGISTDHAVVIVGSGEYSSELQRLNEELGRPAQMVGWLDNDSPEFRELLEASAIYVLPSDYENFPMGLLEAMAAGSAIITTRDEGCKEVVGDAAEFVTPGRVDPEACVREIRSAIERLTTNRDYRAELGVRARRRLDEQFTWPAVAARYVECYQKCVRHSDGVPANSLFSDHGPKTDPPRSGRARDAD